MGMKLSEVKAKVKNATVVWEDETVDVGYHPAAMTPAVLEEVQEAARAENLSVIGSLLEPVLAWWDVLDDDGNRLPTDAATIREIPVPFLMAVLEQVQDAMRPPERGTSSDG